MPAKVGEQCEVGELKVGECYIYPHFPAYTHIILGPTYVGEEQGVDVMDTCGDVSWERLNTEVIKVTELEFIKHELKHD
jgi:hypothetical protein